MVRILLFLTGHDSSMGYATTTLIQPSYWEKSDSRCNVDCYWIRRSDISNARCYYTPISRSRRSAQFSSTWISFSDIVQVSSWNASSDGVMLHGIAAYRSIAISIPHSSPPPGSMVFATIIVSYRTEAPDAEEGAEEEEITRVFKAIRKISTALPVQVSVMDCFRDKTSVLPSSSSLLGVLIERIYRLFSKFTISSTSHLQVRILETKLEGGTGLTIHGAKPGRRRVPIVS